MTYIKYNNFLNAMKKLQNQNIYLLQAVIQGIPKCLRHVTKWEQNFRKQAIQTAKSSFLPINYRWPKLCSVFQYTRENLALQFRTLLHPNTAWWMLWDFRLPQLYHMLILKITGMPHFINSQTQRANILKPQSLVITWREKTASTVKHLLCFMQ